MLYDWLVIFAVPIIHVMASQHRNLTKPVCPSSCVCHREAGAIVSANCTWRGLESVPVRLPKTLKKLTLAHNNITHLKCADLSHLSHLEDLNLSHNKVQLISETFPSVTGCCASHSMRRKNFSYGCSNRTDYETGRGEHSCNSPFSKLTALRKLSLSHNNISRISSNGFSRLSNLLTLDISHNELSALGSDSFIGLHSLRNLSLQNNRLEALPDTIFQDQGNLIQLDVRSNCFQSSHNCSCYQDQALSKLTNIRRLYMDGLPFPCVLGPGFRNLSQLEILDFNEDESCGIDRLTEYFFTNMSFQKHVTIRMIKCKITSIHPNAFSSLHTLVKLDLSQNAAMGCENMKSASEGFPSTAIEEYSVNKINNHLFLRLTPAAFEYIANTSLKVLRMTHNLILFISWDVPLALPKTLEFWDLSYNNVIRADVIFTLSFLINLKILNVSYQNKYHLPRLVADRMKSTDGQDTDCYTTSGYLTPLNAHPRLDGTWHHTKSRDQQFLGTIVNDEFESDAQMDVVLESVLNRDTLSFSQWKKLVDTVCPKFSPNIPISMLNRTALRFTNEHRQLMREANVRRSLTVDFLSEKSRSDNDDIVTFSIPRNLRKVYASELKLGYAIPTFRLEYYNVLWFADASHNFLWCFEGPVLGLDALKYINLSGNFAIAINPRFFEGLRNISHLQLSNNKLATSFELDEDGHILSHLKNLEVLQLSWNSLRVMHPKALEQNRKLKKLLLNHNNLVDLPRISNQVSLTYINVYDNLIPFLSQESMDGLDRLVALSPKIRVDLNHNPLLCDCSSLSFLIWYNRAKVTFIAGENYTCLYINGTRILLAEAVTMTSQLWRQCNGKRFFFASIILFLLMALVVICSACVSYYSYRLLFYVYLSKQRFFYDLYEPARERLRDVFLVYDDQDDCCRRHVVTVVLPNLRRHGLTFHLSETGLDSPSAGRSVREVVEESVLGGRKTVVLLSQDLFLDEEKQLEVSMAKIAGEMLGSRRLLFLEAQKMNAYQLPTHISRLLRISRIISYSPWSESFWVQLAREIRS